MRNHTTLALAVAALVVGYVIAQPPRSSGPVQLLPPHGHIEHGWGGPHPSDYRQAHVEFEVLPLLGEWTSSGGNTYPAEYIDVRDLVGVNGNFIVTRMSITSGDCTYQQGLRDHNGSLKVMVSDSLNMSKSPSDTPGILVMPDDEDLFVVLRNSVAECSNVSFFVQGYIYE
jgi:hypothetical protein